MLKTLKQLWKNGIYTFLAFFIATIGKGAINALLWTCRWNVKGAEHFCKIASQEKCILMLWHNRLALTPFILYRFAPHFIYAAFISNSRDGELIGRMVRSYKAGRVIKVPHHSRHQALRELIRHVEERLSIVIITPDGPRGPRYEMKPGLALAAIETQANVVPLNWKASSYWEFKTWDKLRLPKPFSTIDVFFDPPVHLAKQTLLDEGQALLQNSLGKD